MPEGVEATDRAKPGHYQQVLDALLEFVPRYLNVNPHMTSCLVIGDAGQGVARAVVVYDSHEAASEVNNDPVFAKFADKLVPLMSGAPERVLMDLVHSFQRGTDS